MKNEPKDRSIAQLLRAIRTSGAKKDDNTKELLFHLTGKREGWTQKQCRTLYEAILRHYIDDEDNLELLLAVSGLLDGYIHIPKATKRRSAYLEHLNKTKPDSNYGRYYHGDHDTVRKAEDTVLGLVAEDIQKDLECGNMPDLVKNWTSEPSSALFRFEYTDKGIVIHFHNSSINLLWLALPACVLLVWLFFTFFPKTEKPSKQINVLIPGQVYQIIFFTPPGESIDGLLKYISSDPSLITVSSDGFIMAQAGQDGEISRTADIMVQRGGEILETQTYTVDFTRGSYAPPVADINDFQPNFTVEQKIRLAGTKDWHQTIEAKVGDLVEIQIQYRNLSDFTNNDVMVCDILPVNMVYIPGSTKLYNSNNPDGKAIKDDTIATNDGINIDHYAPGANAYVRFTAKVVDATLETGSNTLVSWSQVCVNGVTLQDYATATLQKSE